MYTLCRVSPDERGTAANQSYRETAVKSKVHGGVHEVKAVMIYFRRRIFRRGCTEACSTFVVPLYSAYLCVSVCVCVFVCVCVLVCFSLCVIIVFFLIVVFTYSAH